MGLYALYCNATPRLPAKDVEDNEAVDDTVKVPEHVVTIAKLGTPAVEIVDIKINTLESDGKCSPSHGKVNQACQSI